MNVIFLDFDGVLDTAHFYSNEDVESRIKILADIAHEYDCKIVIEASGKDAIDPITNEVSNDWVQFILNTLNKYDIDCIGRTPNVCRRLSEYSSLSMWKEDEIRLYLFNHPEIEHFCIIDDNDYHDLVKVSDYLVSPKDYSDNYEEEGLLPKHKEEVGKILSLPNRYQKFAIKHLVKNRS